MAQEREYGYYIKANKIQIVERETNTGDWKSPQAAIPAGLRIEYSYKPDYDVTDQTNTQVTTGYQQASSGKLNTFETIVDSGGNTTDTWAEVDVDGGTGSGARVDITVNSTPVISSIRLNKTYPGSGYSAGDTLTIPAGSLGSGRIASFDATSISDAGSNVEGTGQYTSIALTGGSGSGATATIDVSSGNLIVQVTINNGGNNYTPNDTVTIPAGTLGTGSLGGTINVASMTTGGGGTFDLKALQPYNKLQLNSATNWDMDGELRPGQAYYEGVHIVIRDSDKWNGLHEVINNATSTGLIVNTEYNGTPVTDIMTVIKSVTAWKNESVEVTLPSNLESAVVAYLKAKKAEDSDELEKKEYYLREFRQIVERAKSGFVEGFRRVSAGTHAIR